MYISCRFILNFRENYPILKIFPRPSPNRCLFAQSAITNPRDLFPECGEKKYEF